MSFMAMAILLGIVLLSDCLFWKQLQKWHSLFLKSEERPENETSRNFKKRRHSFSLLLMTVKTSMHSSRMCTTRLLAVSQQGVPAQGGVCLGVVSAQGGLSARGGLPQPHERNDWQTGVKSLPWRNFVAGGNRQRWLLIVYINGHILHVVRPSQNWLQGALKFWKRRLIIFFVCDIRSESCWVHKGESLVLVMDWMF